MIHKSLIACVLLALLGLGLHQGGLLWASQLRGDAPTTGAAQASDKAGQRAAKPAQPTPEQIAEREEAFAKAMTSVVLDGSFTITTEDGDTRTRSEKYTILRTQKVGDLWRIDARIQYGNRDVTVPMFMPVQWAGDTPVITIERLFLPGVGTYSARVLIHNNHYAGYWETAGGVGGNMFGRVRPMTEEEGKAAADALQPVPSQPRDE